MNPLQELEREGQAVWLDFVARGFVAKGELKKLIDEDGLKGVTSNPTIFEKAIGHSDEYDDEIRRSAGDKSLDTGSLYERLAVADIKAAADVLMPVYEATDGADGYVSLEVSPLLAMDSEGTVKEAQRLWEAVGRRNLMVKVPGTSAGLPAIRQLIGGGINVNVTLLFSQDVYEEVANAYIEGVEAFVEKGGDPSRLASVASFFVSRIDSAADAQLEKKGGAAKKLMGKLAIANAKLAYDRYQRLFSGPRWEVLEARGARPQRLLWASTGTKNKAYSDVLYVEELIGPDTVNTMPPATMDAFRDHGKVRATLTEDVASAREVMEAVAKAGVEVDAITARLVDEGVKSFADAFEQLMGGLEKKRRAIAA